MGKKAKPPKIPYSKKKATSSSLAGKIRKAKSREIDNLVESSINTLKKFLETGQLTLAVYLIEHAAAVLGIDDQTFSSLIRNGVIPEGELSPCGKMFFRDSHIKCLTLARSRYIYCDDKGRVCVKREPLKQFLQKYWPQEVYDERKGKWGRRQDGNCSQDSV